MPNLVVHLNQTSIFKWCVVSYGSKNKHPKKQVFRRDWTTCSKHSRLNSQHNWRDLYDCLMSTQIFTLKLNAIFI